MRTDGAARLGDLKKFEVTIDGENVTPSVLSVNVWQDIFTPAWNCDIVFSDTNNVIHTLPIKQGAKVKIKAETKFDAATDGEVEFDFVLFKISDRTFIRSQFQTYTLNCVSQALLKDMSKRVSKHFSGKYDEVAQQIVSDGLGGSLKVEAIPDKIDVIMANWSPMTCIQWLCKSAYKGDDADYVFFMDKDNSFVMEKMEEMYSSKKWECPFNLKQKPADEKDLNGNTDVDDALNITNYTIHHYDALSNISAGFYASKTVSYDMIKKKWSETTHTISGPDASMSSFASAEFKGYTDAVQSFVAINDKLFEGGSSCCKKDSVKQWVGSRRSNIMKSEQDRFFAQIVGGGAWYKYLGYHLKIDLPPHEDQTGEKFDKYFTGTYLITAIHHSIQDGYYSITLELMKKRLDKAM